MEIGGRPATLSPTTMPVAPAASALLALTWNVQTPRSTYTNLPASAEALVNAEQPLVALPSAASSWPTRTSEVTPAASKTGPNDAATALHGPATEAGALIVMPILPRVNLEHCPSGRLVVMSPSSASMRPLIRSTVSPQMSEYDSLRAPGCHW